MFTWTTFQEVHSCHTPYTGIVHRENDNVIAKYQKYIFRPTLRDRIYYSKLTINMTILKKKRALISGKTWILRRTVIAVCTVTTEGTGNAVTPRFTSALRLTALGDAFCRSYYCCSTCLKQQYVQVVLSELGGQSTTHQSCLRLFNMIFFYHMLLFIEEKFEIREVEYFIFYYHNEYFLYIFSKRFVWRSKIYKYSLKIAKIVQSPKKLKLKYLFTLFS